MKSKKLYGKTAGTGMLAAFTASLCCITPVLAFLSGISGIAATFTWIEPFRPYLIAITVIILGFAWYLKLRPQKAEVDCDCEDEESKTPFIQTKKFLALVTVFAAVFLTFPSYSHVFYPDIKKEASLDTKLNLVKLEVKGMTCTGCEDHVKHAAMELEGVFQTDASWTNERAEVVFNENITPLDTLIYAINKTGYSVKEVISINEIDKAEIKRTEKSND